MDDEFENMRGAYVFTTFTLIPSNHLSEKLVRVPQ